jgi:hypothetical protein
MRTYTARESAHWKPHLEPPTLVSSEAKVGSNELKWTRLAPKMDSGVFVGGVAIASAICPTVATPSG